MAVLATKMGRYRYSDSIEFEDPFFGPFTGVNEESESGLSTAHGGPVRC